MSGIPVFSAGTSLQSSGASVSAQIPADSAGMLPLFVRVTATAAGYFKLSQDGASAAVGDLLIQPSDGLILKTCGLSQFSFVSQSGASVVTVTPIDVGGIKYPTNIFTPAALFTTGINGAWYDPSDFSTMFQDAAGTTPVTAVEQPVGLMLDKSKGLVLGPELVTNGDFSNGTTGWVTANGGAVVNSRCECTAASNFLSTTAAILTVGKWYSAEFDYFMTAGAKLRVATKDTIGPDVATIVATSQSLVTNAVTRLKIKFQAAVGGFFILQASDATFSGWVDNISVRELPGNHAYNPSGNSANFPVLQARYNLLTNTGFSGAVAGTPGTAPTGWSIGFGGGSLATPSQDVITMSVTGVARQYLAQGSITIPANASVKVSFVVTAYTGASSEVIFWPIPQAGSLVSQIGLSAADCPIGSRASITLTAGASGATLELRFGCGTVGSPSGAMSVSFTAPDIRVANDAINQPAYQRVNTATDYDAVGFKPYMSFNGVNQWLQTNSIDFTYGDKMFVSAGVRKLSDAATGMLVELSSTLGTNNGAFADYSDVGTFTSVSKGTSAVYAYFAVTAPATKINSSLKSISTPSNALRLNGSQVAINTASQGTGNYGNYPLYIGARAGSSLWFNGRLYGLVVAGKQATSDEIASTESWLNQKTGAY